MRGVKRNDIIKKKFKKDNNKDFKIVATKRKK